MIEGTYGFVYCSVNGLGMGVFTIKGEQFIGVDSGGVNYDGTAKEQEDGSIVLDVKISLPIRLRNAPNSKRPKSPGGSCAAVSFIRKPQRDMDNAAARSCWGRGITTRCPGSSSATSGSSPYTL